MHQTTEMWGHVEGFFSKKVCALFQSEPLLYLPVVNGVKEMGIPGMKENLLYLEGPHNSTIAMEYPHF